ncbi:unnamed protein product [Peniophora sp. CBMAI 1063]|nr:unnamed protein product [Peniophora sp. CBMAI 1063]
MARTKFQLPPELWSNIFTILLDEQAEAQAQSSSNIQPLADWTPLPDHATCPPCIPHCNAYTDCGARTKQTQICTANLARERRGLQALLHVNSVFRALIRGKRYFAQNAFTDLACRLEESHYPVQSGDMLYPCTGLCLCLLPEILRRLRLGAQGLLGSQRVHVILPSRNQHGPHSPAQSISQILHQYGADHLVEASFYFDPSDQTSDEDGDQSIEGEHIIASESIERFEGQNWDRVIVGNSLTFLKLRAEVERHTWDRSVLCRILRSCPLLENVQLLSVFDHNPRYWFYPDESPIILEHLSSLHIQASVNVWIGLARLLVTPVLYDAHIDVIVSPLHLQENQPRWPADLDCILFSRTDLGKRLGEIVSGDDLSADLHYKCDVDEGSHGSPMPHSLPEYMSIRVADHGGPYSLSITIRSAMTCPLAYAPPGTRAGCVPSRTPAALLEEFLTNTLLSISGMLPSPYSVNRSIHELDVTGYAELLRELRWPVVLRETNRLECLRVYGINSKGSALDRLLEGLCAENLETYTLDGLLHPPDLAYGDCVTEVHLPDCPYIPLEFLEDELSLRRPSFCSPITWFGAT